MEDKRNIFYQPDLRLEKHYETEGKFEDKGSYIKTTESEVQTIPSLIKEIETLKKALIFVPDPIKKVIDTMLITLHFILILADDEKITEDLTKDKDSIINGNTVGDLIIIEHKKTEFEDDDEEEVPDGFFNKRFRSKKITTERLTLADKINRKYYKGVFSISNSYLDKIKSVLNNYNVNLISSIPIKDLEILEKSYTLSYDQLVEQLGEEKGHLSDFLVKTEKVRHQKERMLHKLFNDEKSLVLIKKCELSRSLLCRYYDKEKTGDFLQDSILMQQIKGEEMRLDQNINQLYRYLNSSIVLTDECLSLYLREGIIKDNLNKEGIEKI